MSTKPQDVVVALKLVKYEDQVGYAILAAELGMSASEVHAAVRRLGEARLLEPESRTILREPFLKFLVHGVPHAFPARLGELTRGLPTAWASEPLAAKLLAPDASRPVWPDPEGRIQGLAVKPLYPSVPFAARRDPELHALLALVDALRLGRARERTLAEQTLKETLKSHASA